MDSRILEISIGRPATVDYEGREVSTGIFKSAVQGPVHVTRDGMLGDGQADLTVHGGHDKAVYVYPDRHYATWAAELGVAALATSQFGENLRVDGWTEQTVAIGDRFRFGSVTAIVSQPRLPCFKLGIRMGDDDFPRRFLQSGRLGWYLRIEAEGETAAGDTFSRISRASHGITVERLWRIVFCGEGGAIEAAACLDSLPHLDAGWQRRLRQLARRAG